MMTARGAGLVVLLAAAMLVACAPTYTNPKKLSREDVAVDVLDCQKAAVLRYKAARLRNSEDNTSYEARQRAAAAGRAAYERCLKARGWKKNG
jgi:hypothetical protein